MASAGPADSLPFDRFGVIDSTRRRVGRKVGSALFVGFSGPVGYDYWRGGDRSNHSSPPNAVLEDVTGILLCYDQLVFLSRDFCPKDLWHLPYVRFISDDTKALDRALVAYDQAQELLKEHGSLGWGSISRTFSRTVSKMVGKSWSGGVDNHTQGLFDIDGFEDGGNSARADTILIDQLIAASLEMEQLDVLTNSVANEVARQKLSSEACMNRFNAWHVEVAAVLGSVRVPNRWGVEGGYHEDIETLRGHPEVSAFRAELGKRESNDAPPLEMAARFTAEAADYGRQALQRLHRKTPLYETLGRGAIGPVGNAMIPMLGTILNGALRAFEIVSEHRERSKSAWAAFVVSI